MPGSKANAFRWHQILEGISNGRRNLVDCRNDGFVLLRTGNGEHIWMYVENSALICAQAACDDDPAVFI